MAQPHCELGCMAGGSVQLAVHTLQLWTNILLKLHWLSMSHYVHHIHYWVTDKYLFISGWLSIEGWMVVSSICLDCFAGLCCLELLQVYTVKKGVGLCVKAKSVL